MTNDASSGKKRIPKLNILIQNTLSHILHTVYRNQAVNITLTAVDTSPDLRNVRIYYSVISDEKGAAAFLKTHQGTLRTLMAKHITLKYTPRLSFVYDKGLAHGNRMIDILNSLDHPQMPS